MTGAGLAIRRAGPDDAAAVRALTRAAYTRWVPLIGREPWPMTADYDHGVRAHRIDLLVDGTALTALVELVDEDDVLLIENLAVDPARQGRGHGATLLRHAEAVASAAGRRTLRLYTNAHFVENLRFYIRHGFTVTREEPIADGTVIHMAKPIASQAGPR